ncbi:hypothetical protein N7541_011504 [Penicillium brevicompactum]|uniref:Uncharacterized protein n=1 Tax=Penicillium brevicompactum TaxID=5074 RepID=A0A9W9UK44_PENBR|nr:hypothetical protein N7541_011504 [Penicillium brevicompactum]
MPRPKKSTLPKQKTTLLSFWQPSSVPKAISVPAENSIEISDLAKKVACLVPQGLHSGLDALDWSGEVSIHYRGSEEVVDSNEISAKADLSNGKGRGKSAPISTKWTPHGNPMDITGQEDPYEKCDEEWKGKAPMREFDILSNKQQGSHACV